MQHGVQGAERMPGFERLAKFSAINTLLHGLLLTCLFFLHKP